MSTITATQATASATASATPTSTMRTSDCRKFSPNIFNKSKCSHCFRQREEHSAAALESNRASRKVSKRGYLFVAPDWDFSNPLYRTKRWQRRWFVLYDDGELTYSVDEHPETVPQACIDMTKVLEVTTAEDVTGHPYSIAITAPERVTFVKGTCSEESKWWLNVLAAFPKSKGRHKRNATFPGGQATTILQATNSDAGTTATTRNRHNSYHKDALTSAQSAASVLIGSSDEKSTSGQKQWRSGSGIVADLVATKLVGNSATTSTKTTITTSINRNEQDDEEQDDGVETGEDVDDDEDDDDNDINDVNDTETAQNAVDSKRKSKSSAQKQKGNVGGQDENNRNAGNEITNRVSPTCLLIEDIRRDEKTIKDIANTITNLSQQQNKRWSTTAVNNVLNSHHHHSTYQQTTSTRDETDHSPNAAGTTTIVNLRPKSLPLAANSTPAIVSAIVKKIPPVLVSAQQSTITSASTALALATAETNNNNSNTTNNNNNKCKSSPRLQLQLKHLQQRHQSNQQQHRQQQQQQQQLQHQQKQHTHKHYQHERGDPDGGCNLDDLSNNYLVKTAEFRVKPATVASPIIESNTKTMSAMDSTDNSHHAHPAGESLNAKKGWLMKQDNRTGEWSKHWFTLNGAALFYYRDPVSEERGVLDDVLDVNRLTNVAEVNTSSRNYAFQLTTWDKQRLTLASLSPNSRNSWIAVLRNAAGLQAQQEVMNSISTSNTTAVTQRLSTSVEVKTKTLTSGEELDLKSEIEKDFIKAQQLEQKPLGDASPNINAKPKAIGTQSALSPLTPTTPKTLASHFSSDEEYRTASEGGRRDSIDWGSPLSPSPPIPMTVLRAKERMRTRTMSACPRLHKRSRSSPPSSRRSTVDSVGSDDLPLPLIHTVQEELNIDKELKYRLSAVEKECDLLRDEAKERERRMSELLVTLERTEQELNSRIQEMEEVREQLTTELSAAKQNAADIVERLSVELEESQRKIKALEDRLARGIDENESLYKRLRELEGGSPASFSNLNRHKMKRMDSLSDLTTISDIDPYCLERDSLAEEYNELRTRFEKAVNEIKAMKRELKESQNQFDSLEISYATLKQDLERKEIEDRAQLQMMAARIQDLTLKYSSSERQVRTLKQKLAKLERRRSLSLKGKEQLSIPKELELKVCELEAKIDEIEKTTTTGEGKQPVYMEPQKHTAGKRSTRRRSLESTNVNANAADTLHFMVRINDLEKRFESVSGSNTPSSASTPTSSTPTLDATTSGMSSQQQREQQQQQQQQSPAHISGHLIERLRCLENVLIASKDRLEQSLQQLQNLRTTRTRRSVSPITERKDSYRYVERALIEVVKLIRESCETCVVSGSIPSVSSGTTKLVPQNLMLLPESSPVRTALTQLEAQLRNKLADLLKQRRMLRERNELTKSKDLELLAERVAYESVCFGRLRDSVARAEDPELFGVRQTRAEVAETSHLMTMLKAKLSGKCALKPSGSLDILAGVLARRLVLSAYRKDGGSLLSKAALEPVDQNILDDLMRQQNEINVIAKRYKNNAMENLATGLAAETLSYISANDLVQGAVQEAWRQAQETVNAELVQSEIAHIMMRNAERFEHTTTPAFGYTLTAEERLSFEKFADAVHDTLRKEMEQSVAQLTRCYEEALQKLKRGQWRLHLEQERKASEGRQLLSEFADIIAHKALIDARIAVLRGEYSMDIAPSSAPVDHKKISVLAMQKYENLFEELSTDLQINNADDILVQADFDFMYKQHTIDFLNDRQVLSDISSFLSQLEDSLIALQCEAAAADDSTTSISRSAIEIESLQDVCHKCCDLRQRADQLLQEVHRKLNAPCTHCLQVREKLCSLQQQHETELVRLQHTHTKEMNALMQQLEQQRTALTRLETERDSLNGDLNRSEELIEERERDLGVVQQKLQAKEQELRRHEESQRELLQRIDVEAEKQHSFQEESDALTMKCARQDEEYALLLQERDYLQGEYSKEQERCKRLEKRLELLEREHGKQLECLQEAYRDQLLSHCSDFSNAGDEESFRQRYQTEIEQLRTLCEKGLTAMESSHRRIISDLEERHRQEIDRLLVDKETALAEETQATLAALDAMRKAHQSEVQREVARFKQEFLRQMQKGESTLDTAKVKEEELEELRQEILSFSEKYSIKCVENAALEEKLRVANQKLKHFQQMQQIELRNKQFRAHLASEDPTCDVNFVQGLTISKDDAACQDSEPTVVRDASLEQSFFVIPSSNLSCKRQKSIVNSKEILYRANNIVQMDILDQNDGIDVDAVGNDSDDLLINRRYSYEPCYKLNAIHTYQQRLSLQGIKTSSTFGKSLKSTAKQTEAITTTTTTTLSTTANTAAAITRTTTTTNTATSPASSNPTPIKTKTIHYNNNNNNKNHNQQFKITTTTIINNHNNNKNNLNENKNNIEQINTKLELLTATTTEPVEQPKNISANKLTNDYNKLLNINNQLNVKLKQLANNLTDAVNTNEMTTECEQQTWKLRTITANESAKLCKLTSTKKWECENVKAKSITARERHVNDDVGDVSSSSSSSGNSSINRNVVENSSISDNVVYKVTAAGASSNGALTISSPPPLIGRDVERLNIKSMNTSSKNTPTNTKQTTTAAGTSTTTHVPTANIHKFVLDI